MRPRQDWFDLISTSTLLLVVLAALLVHDVTFARADALADCNEAVDAAARIAGCDIIIMTNPAPDVLAVALMNRGIGHAQRGELEMALEDLDAALAASPALLAARYNRGNVHLDLGRAEPAISDFAAVIESEPGFALAWLNRGLARERSGASAAAGGDFRRALELDPKLDAARRGLARLKRSR